MLFAYPHPYPFRDGSTDKNECSNSMTLDGTKTNDLSYYQKPFIDTTQERRSDKYQAISVIFEIESERSAKVKF